MLWSPALRVGLQVLAAEQNFPSVGRPVLAWGPPGRVTRSPSRCPSHGRMCCSALALEAGPERRTDAPRADVPRRGRSAGHEELRAGSRDPIPTEEPGCVANESLECGQVRVQSPGGCGPFSGSVRAAPSLLRVRADTMATATCPWPGWTQVQVRSSGTCAQVQPEAERERWSPTPMGLSLPAWFPARSRRERSGAFPRPAPL